MTKHKWKGIVLAGGSGSRLYPLTRTVTKQLLPVYDKPMIYYPISALMLAGIRDFLIITTPNDLPRLQEFLGTGEELGLRINYKAQPTPDGIAQAFIIGADFIGDDPVCLILGDNIFYGEGFPKNLTKAVETTSNGATVFGYHVNDPHRYGIVEFNRRGQATGIEEKPKNPRSNWAVTGLYFYAPSVVEIARNLRPSARGELEITDVNKAYLDHESLKVERLGRGIAWLDMGTPNALLDAAEFVRVVEQRQGLKIACLEEIAYKMGFIDASQVRKLASGLGNCDYGRYLMNILERTHDYGG